MNVAIITAGGSGRRMNSATKKQFIKIAGRPLLFWTIDKFIVHPQIDEIILALPQDELNYFSREIKTEFPEKKIQFIGGGKERQDSVFNALQICSIETKFVLIHDGVRPFISQNCITKLLQIVKEKKAVIPAFPSKNTIKKISGEKIIETVPREEFINVMTPEVFDFQLIQKYAEKAQEQNIHFTDDASLLEHFGEKVFWIPCPAINFKITDSYDLALTKSMIENNMGVDK